MRARTNPRPSSAASTIPAVKASTLSCAVLDAVEQAVVGKRPALELVLAGILAGGHVLLEDMPGLGKTLAARSFAQALGLPFTRAQFTPDLLPALLWVNNTFWKAVFGAPADSLERSTESGRGDECAWLRWRATLLTRQT